MSDFARCINDIQEHRELVHIVYKSHERWPLPGLTAQDQDRPSVNDSQRDLRISVLDSSFNPPTLAHLALARSRPPIPSSSGDSDASDDYDARLLLLSVQNADKAAPKAGEATYEHRLQMMILLATTTTTELEDSNSSTRPSDSNHPSLTTVGNIAVAIIDEPTFVRKSAVLHQFLPQVLEKLIANTSSLEEEHVVVGKSGGSGSEKGPGKLYEGRIKLSFIMGYDTLERFVAPRYYNNSLEEMRAALHKFFAPHPDGDASQVVCAWRGKQVREMLPTAQPYIASGSIAFVLLSGYEMSLSSTEVRSKRRKGFLDWKPVVPPRVADYITQFELYK